MAGATQKGLRGPPTALCENIICATAHHGKKEPQTGCPAGSPCALGGPRLLSQQSREVAEFPRMASNVPSSTSLFLSSHGDSLINADLLTERVMAAGTNNITTKCPVEYSLLFL